MQFLAIMLTAVALVPGGAHLFALPNKIGLAQNDYFIVQNIYRGWALFGAVIVPALIAHGTVALMLRRQTRPLLLSLGAVACLLLSLAVFFTWTYPANVATANWLEVPDNWDTLRRHWEYSHAVGATLTFAALCASTLSALLSEDEDGDL